MLVIHDETYFLSSAVTIFLIGIWGILSNLRNFFITMLAIESTYIGILLAFLLTAITHSDPHGQIFSMILLIVAASESALGLGILISIHKFGKSIDFASYQEPRG